MTLQAAISTETTILIGLVAALLGALATGAIQVGMAFWDRRVRRRAAAMVVLGDIAVVEKAFALMIDRGRW